ncbi:DUF1343 domain-containing protein [Flavobacterium sp. xlx-214]|uniref:exo-beta-N-acetylmuramidase NamZ family protein n=1 Tax=unclassified Flavobacterium TaxID=196869 RepID=UPI0013D0F728|nr:MULTISPECIES: DUF1343 domain-containing protein [unclassified Flavobacterium]MBA5792786.1 DUF1343 domain-containing protein [Flavobacterium sp. xlx-221]QMI83923.1 DUF1343 domain-containing protein [Flavobacterium sp. xlx-214]
MKSIIHTKNTFLFFVLSLFTSLNFACWAQENYIYENSIIETGANQSPLYLPLLKDKKVGILTNQTGIVKVEDGIVTNGSELKSTTHKYKIVHLVDFLIEKNINLKKIYAPEHGFRGTADAGELIKDGKDTKTGLPIISLYGNNKKPNKEQLAGIDVMIFDLQDVGARFYTYISSLHYVMEACAENNIPLIVLDRPNPKGATIDGPVLEMENKSFVGMHPIPVLHGMTIGEYAQMINGEKWLKNGVQAQLTVIPVANYNKSMAYSLPVKPSPNLPNDLSINLYTSLCFFEGTNVSSGRGTNKQFQIYGSPFLKNTIYSFTPKPNDGAKDPMHNGTLCYGEDLSNHKPIDSFSLEWLLKAYKNTSNKEKFFNNFFIKLAGTKKLQQQIEKGLTEKEIKATWKAGLEDFKKTRAKYLLYTDF